MGQQNAEGVGAEGVWAHIGVRMRAVLRAVGAVRAVRAVRAEGGWAHIGSKKKLLNP